MVKRAMFVYNPNAGKGKVKSSLHVVIDGFTRMEYLVAVFPTQYKKHAQMIVSKYAKRFELIICSGGDGTLNEVVSGLMQVEQEKRPQVAYIPTGTVNDFATTLRLSSNVNKALQIFEKKNAFPCDICSFNERHFTYIAAFGAFTPVSYKTSQSIKNVLGRAAYFLEGMKQFSSITNYHLHLESAERIIDDDFVFGAITNAKSVAGFHSINTKCAQLDDGEFEVLLIRMPKNPLDLQIIITALLKQEINEKFMEFFISSHLTIDYEKACNWTLDGEEGGYHQHVEITMKNKAITFLV